VSFWLEPRKIIYLFLRKGCFVFGLIPILLVKICAIFYEGVVHTTQVYAMSLIIIIIIIILLLLFSRDSDMEIECAISIYLNRGDATGFQAFSQKTTSLALNSRARHLRGVRLRQIVTVKSRTPSPSSRPSMRDVADREAKWRTHPGHCAPNINQRLVRCAPFRSGSEKLTLTVRHIRDTIWRHRRLPCAINSLGKCSISTIDLKVNQ
jgi:hypothetical protein